MTTISRARYSILEVLADQTKNTFTGLIRQRQIEAAKPPVYTPGARWDWESIAAFIFDNKLPFYSWIKFVCEQSRAPQPNHLKSPKIMVRYRESAGWRQVTEAREAQLKLEGQQALVAQQLQTVIDSVEDGDIDLSKAAIICSVLCDDVQPLSWLFRYCWAMDAGMHGIAEEYEDGAICEYLFSPDLYDEVWGEWIPAAFKREIRRAFDL